MSAQDAFPTRAADEEVELEHVAQACEPEDDYESEEGVRLFFERLNAGWYVGADGRLKPPKKPLTLDQLGVKECEHRVLGSGGGAYFCMACGISNPPESGSTLPQYDGSESAGASSSSVTTDDETAT